jgi:hypothetical protein
MYDVMEIYSVHVIIIEKKVTKYNKSCWKNTTAVISVEPEQNTYIWLFGLKCKV